MKVFYGSLVTYNRLPGRYQLPGGLQQAQPDTQWAICNESNWIQVWSQTMKLQKKWQESQCYCGQITIINQWERKVRAVLLNRTKRREDSYCWIPTLLLLLNRVESLLIPSYILLTDQFVITAIRIAVWIFPVYHLGPLKRADRRVCQRLIICEDIALFVCVYVCARVM